MSSLLFIFFAAACILIVWLKKPDLPANSKTIVNYRSDPSRWKKYAFVLTVLACVVIAMNAYTLILHGL